MIPIKQFKIISKNFRRVSGYLLHANDQYEAIRLASRFLSYIDNEPIIADFIKKNHTEEFNIETIRKEKRYQNKFEIPIDPSDEISFIYQLLKYGVENFDSYTSLTNGYAFYKGAKYADQISEFNHEVVRLLVFHITDYLEEMAIELGYDEKPNSKVVIQGGVGQFNYAEQGNIEANQANYNEEGQDTQKIVKELISLLKVTELEDKDTKEDAIDFLGEISQKIEQGEEVQPSLWRRVNNSLKNINETVGSSSQLAMTINQFLTQLGQYIS